MALDPERASFLLVEYRRSRAVSAAVRADYPNARDIVLDTNIATVAGADSLSAQLLDLLDAPARVFEVMVQSVDAADLSQFDGTPPVFALAAPRFAITAATQLLPAAVEIDHAGGTSRLTLRG